MTKPRLISSHPAHTTLASLLYHYGLRCRDVIPDTPGGMYQTPLLTKQNLADLLGVSRVSVLGWVQTGKLVPLKDDPETGWPLFNLDDILAIARNAIREGLAPALLTNPLPGPAPTKVAPR
jgi:hypothetical protein